MLSTAGLNPRPCTNGMPLRMIEPSRLSPKPRRITASWVPASVLVWVMPLILISASSRLRGRWSLSTCRGTTLTTCEVSSGDVAPRKVVESGIAR